MKKVVSVQGEYIQLNQLLKKENVAMSGGAAKEMIENGSVRVNGAVETQVRKKLRTGDTVQVGRQEFVIDICM